ncbi:dicarboxylate/amino acid:cation symporter [Novosphingobium album (ex Liu et al. 2023)]|uniref:Cation:dicarboxylase symporter family transporter n=1 Tax=Novosphingobium album (ex Liu et al. 2023) TaxID=3031130 RepID=A0ABT5WNI0_9SPHN|nr:cation:dicarboxylase symporter family transporter [Novosphingobium album (ex Liu et al. 2023)]MDE8651606.1 cation:dicarboxylase symporter family transporter [Novosphingobium album (ex Liu et al. 2023)]
MNDEAGPSRMPEIRVPGLLTLAGLVCGLLLGLLLHGTTALPPLLALAEPAGGLWLQALKMTILPLVAGLLFTGIVETVAAARAGAMARRTLGFIVALLAASAVLGAVGMPLLLDLSPAPAGIALRGPGDPGSVPGIGDFVRSLLPGNVVTAAAGDAMLPVIVFVALFALASTRLAEAPRRQLALLFAAMAGAMMVVIGWVLALAPIGVFALGLSLAAQSGAAAIGALAHYITLVSTLGAVMLLAAYPLARLVARLPLGTFARAAMPVQVVAISTQSSLASLPAMLAASRKLGLATTTAEFVLPLAVTLFRVTSPAMNVGAVIYAASLAGVDLPPSAIAAGALVAFVTTVGSVSLPGTVSFIASTAPIAAAMGVPLWPLGVLVAVEMLPDIMRTVGNVTMDVAVAGAVDAGKGIHGPEDD